MKPFLKFTTGVLTLVFLIGFLLALVGGSPAAVPCILAAMLCGGLRALLAVDTLF